MSKSSFPIRTWLIYCLSIIFLFGCSRNPVTGKRELSFMSTSQELAMGAQSDPQVVAEFGLYEDDKLQAFIDEKGQKMAKVSHRPDLDYEFKILNSPVVKAFSLPGVYIYFTRCNLSLFSNESDIAGILEIEIGHLTSWHCA